MARQKTQPTTVAPVAHKRLKKHVSALQSAFADAGQPKPSITDVVSALIIYTPPPQLAGMVAEWQRYNHERAEAEKRGETPPDPPSWL
jgi:hypothetical protein